LPGQIEGYAAYLALLALNFTLYTAKNIGIYSLFYLYGGQLWDKFSPPHRIPLDIKAEAF
jgi:hypothetical protein